MESAGFVARVASPRDGRVRDLVLADRGRALLQAVEEVYAEIEGEWALLAGADDLVSARRALSAVVAAADDTAQPAVRPIW
jgi:DNA-binding MarR family transcriptional regulator